MSVLNVPEGGVSRTIRESMTVSTGEDINFQLLFLTFIILSIGLSLGQLNPNHVKSFWQPLDLFF